MEGEVRCSPMWYFAVSFGERRWEKMGVDAWAAERSQRRSFRRNLKGGGSPGAEAI